MRPVDVRERFEFLSPAWIDAAGTFVKRAMAERPELAESRFTLCESFSNAPASVAGPDGRAAWHLRISGGDVRADAGEIDDADLQVTGDYQAVLAMAQAVYAAGADAMARAQRELVHRHGPDALRVEVRRPPDAAVSAILADLHDHVASGTIENPDLAHRLARLGLTKQAGDLAEQGYCVVENAISHELADELRAVVENEVRSHHPFTTNGLLLRNRLFEEVAAHPAACALGQSVLGQSMILGAMSATYKEAGPGLIGLHADYPLVPDPFPEFGLIAVACWALDEWTIDAGPTYVIPGSHLWHRSPGRTDNRDGGVPIVMPKGSIAMWAHGVWHWQGERTAPGARVVIHVTYNRVFVRPLDDLSALSAEHVARNGPAFSTLLGLDDPFGKSSYQGHDGPRFAYAGRDLNR